jgi:hypothetical protein
VRVGEDIKVCSGRLAGPAVCVLDLGEVGVDGPEEAVVRFVADVLDELEGGGIVALYRQLTSTTGAKAQLTSFRDSNWVMIQSITP